MLTRTHALATVGILSCGIGSAWSSLLRLRSPLTAARATLTSGAFPSPLLDYTYPCRLFDFSLTLTSPSRSCERLLPPLQQALVTAARATLT